MTPSTEPKIAKSTISLEGIDALIEENLSQINAKESSGSDFSSVEPLLINLEDLAKERRLHRPHGDPHSFYEHEPINGGTMPREMKYELSFQLSRLYLQNGDQTAAIGRASFCVSAARNVQEKERAQVMRFLSLLYQDSAAKPDLRLFTDLTSEAHIFKAAKGLVSDKMLRDLQDPEIDLTKSSI